MKLLLLVSIFVFVESTFAANWKKNETEHGFDYDNEEKDTNIHRVSVMLDKNSQIQRVAIYHQGNAHEIAIEHYNDQREARESFRWDLRMILLGGQIPRDVFTYIMNHLPLEPKPRNSPLGGSGSMAR